MAATLLNGSAHLLQLLMGGGIINTRKLVSWDMTQHGCPFMGIHGCISSMLQRIIVENKVRNQ